MKIAKLKADIHYLQIIACIQLWYFILVHFPTPKVHLIILYFTQVTVCLSATQVDDKMNNLNPIWYDVVTPVWCTISGYCNFVIGASTFWLAERQWFIKNISFGMSCGHLMEYLWIHIEDLSLLIPSIWSTVLDSPASDFLT